MLSGFSSYTFFPAQPWSHAWERQHEIMFRLAGEIPKEIYVFPPLGLVEYNLFSMEIIEKIFQKLKKSKSKNNCSIKRENMSFIDSLYIHKFDGLSTKINYELLKKNLKNDEGSNFFWSTYVNPTVYEFFKKSQFRVLDLAERRQKNEYLSLEMKQLEMRAVSEAELVVVDNLSTYEDYKHLSENIVYIPQGYDHDLIKLEKETIREKIGYIGHLHSHIDYDYLFDLINLNSDKEFLIVGGILDDRAEKLKEYKNVVLTGQVEKSLLPKYLKEMKYGLIPYKVNDFTEGVFPTKLFEYLGAGVAVVSTHLPEVLPYHNKKNVFVESLPSNINHQISLEGLENFLKENTWEARFSKYMLEIERTINQ